MHAPQKPIYALVIGNDNYKGESKLDKAVNDARAFKEMVEEKGVRVFYITNCTIKELNAIKNKFLSMIRKGDVVLVFFAGHGVTYHNHNRLLAIAEGEKLHYKNDSLSLQVLICECVTPHRVRPSPYKTNVCLNNQCSIEDQGAKYAVLILDCCRTFKYNEAKSRNATRSPSGATGTLVAFGCRANSFTREGKGKHGKYLFKTLTPQCLVVVPPVLA